MPRIANMLLLWALCGPAAAQMHGPDYARCRDRPTTAIVDCVNASARVWDRRLNSSYQALLGRSEPAQREALRAAQRAWVRYRDANCRFHAAGAGSLGQVEGVECLRAMTQQRACEIEAAGSGEARAGPSCE